MSAETIVIACDHGGIDMKALLKADLESAGYEILDLGTDSEDSVDYPDFAYALTSAINGGKASRGILICGTGIGISIAANRNPNIRAAVVHDALSARLCREHNDANVLCLGARLIGPEVARDCLDIFLKTAFGGGRHIQRVEKLSNLN